MTPTRISPIRGRREYRGRTEGFDDDERDNGIERNAFAAGGRAQLVFEVVNDGTSGVAAGFVYGRNPTDSGRITLAGGDIEPIYLAVSGGPPGKKFFAMVVGPATAMASSSVSNLTKGSLAWLDTTQLGSVTPTKPATGQAWFVGRFASTHIGPGRKVQLDLFIFPQSAGGI